METSGKDISSVAANPIPQSSQPQKSMDKSSTVAGSFELTGLEGGSIKAGSSTRDTVPIESTNNLKRGLKARHLQMIAMGGTIGTGLFIGSGAALSKSGPVGALIAYAWVGTLVYSVMLSLGEMATYLPISGAFTAYATRFVDASLGFALGWIYWFSWAVTYALELTAVGLIIQYWDDNLSIAIFISIFWVLITLVNFLPVKVYGELEFWAASIKVITIIGFILFGICIDAGAGKEGYLGFTHWVHPGPFAEYLVSGSTGKFVGFWAVLIQAGFSYQGTELVGIAVAEVQNPRQTVPSAIQKTFYRILLFFVGTVFFIGLLIPYNNKSLLSSASDATASPFVIAAQLAGVKVLPGIINAVLLTVVLSAANSNVYSGSRILVGLAESGLAPRFLGRTNRHGVPYLAVLVTSAVGLLAFLNVSSSAGTVFNWLVNISGVAGFICWCSISLSHIRFMGALRQQGISRETLPFVARYQPWFSYYGFGFMSLITVTQGFTCFIPWDTSSFFVNYVSLILFAVLYTGHKLWFKTRMVKLEHVDLLTGRKEGVSDDVVEFDVPRHQTWKQRIVSMVS
ncbi:putative Arginine transporter [Taphrina deformans PYCC 5710]|uniref:Arginine transporter n=1 Tax=Taphrina deformans (strain PYCC 5710 / ATCC 11124 / CBS 356.35 / IMI 108563 / JCM 9778 / NBRC 8474) TaxID=1097556 RepID=R4X6T5_TAPDE|nr:putative Arginine transporter [Taphrina deformans PYCC 5710]|eukprot:CCG80921.1 putative Arginine transporter [Taphrina deformans PYCC 5710]